MKILILSVESPERKNKYPDFTSYSLAAVLKRDAFHTRLREVGAGEIIDDEFVEMAAFFEALYFRADHSNWPLVMKTSIKIKTALPSIPIIIGGPFASIFDEHVLSSVSADYAIRGEEEKTLPRLLMALDKKKESPADLPGLTFIKDGSIIKTNNSKLLREKDLERLPFPLYEMLPKGKYTNLSLETSRGTPFYSPFVTDPNLKTWRSVSSTGIHERLYRYGRDYLNKVSSRVIVVTDPYFTAKIKRIYDLDKLLEKKPLVPMLSFRARIPDFLHEENLVKTLPRFTEEIIFEPICGYNKGLMNLNQSYTTSIIKMAMKILQAEGLAGKTRFKFTLGLPFENENMVKKTIDFAKFLKEEYGAKSDFEIYSLKPGSIWCNEQLKEGKIGPEYFDIPEDERVNEGDVFRQAMAELVGDIR